MLAGAKNKNGEGNSRFTIVAIAALTLLVALATVWSFHIFVSRPDAINQRHAELDAILQERLARIDGLSQERTRFAHSLAALGESLYAMKRSEGAGKTRTEWESTFSAALRAAIGTFPGIVGAGIWYEPYVFDPTLKHRGYYAQWTPAIGENRKLEFTMEWSDPKNDYHAQDWYRALIPTQAAQPSSANEVVWTQPYSDPVTGVVMITVDAPMYDPDGKIIGMSTVDWNLDQIGRLIEETKPTSQSKTYLVDNTGTQFVAVSNAPELALQKLENSLLGKLLIENGITNSIRNDETTLSGIRYHHYAGRLPSGLIFGFLVPTNEMLGTVLHAQFIQISTISVCLILAFVILIITSQKIHKKQVEFLQVARDQAVSAAKLKGDFLANMSHEIRTPMNGVLGMLDLCLDRPLENEVRDLMLLARDSATGLLRIINDILDFSKIEAGKMDVARDPFPYMREIYRVIALSNVSIKQKQLELVVHTEPNLPVECIGDAARFSQVMINIIGNAIKFTGNKGGIAIIVSRGDNPANPTIKISVTDSGIGIPESDLESIFAPFTQVDTSATRTYGGTGLGLTIVKNLVEGMGGSITARSRPGIGSVFIVEMKAQTITSDDDFFSMKSNVSAAPVPETQLPPEPTPASLPAVEPEELTGLKILIAEDNPVNQQLARRLLTREGHNVTVVDDGKKALERLQKEEFDIVLMDIQMPVMDGISATKAIREFESKTNHSHIPIVAVTANAMNGDRETYLASGMDDYVSKPIDKKILLKTINAIVRDNKTPS